MPRILSPDEFDQAKQLSATQLSKAQFPVLPPVFAPKDAVKRLNPNSGAPDKAVSDQAADALDSSALGQSSGLAGILTRNVVSPMVRHPVATAATAVAASVPGVGFALAGSMGYDLYKYAVQKSAEMSLPADALKQAMADPEYAGSRIKGEQAGTEAAMLALAPIIHSALKMGDVSGGMMEAGAKGLDGMKGPMPQPFTQPSGAKMLGALAGKAGLPADASPYPPDSDLHATWQAAHTDAAQQVELAAAGGERFSGLPVTAELRARVEQHMTDVKDAWNTMFAPASRTPEAGQAANILRATTGEAAAQYEQAAFKLDDFRRAIEPLPDEDKLGFIDAIENGQSQANPEFQGPADAIRKILDDGRQAVQNLGTGKLDHFIENYFPHIWEDPERAKVAFGQTPLEEAKIQTGGKRPMEGGKSFLKQRTIPTTAEGIALGLKPVSTNPVDLTLLKLREMQRYVMAHQSLQEMNDQGLVKYVGAGAPRPDGYVRIDDNIATVFGPKEGAVTLPEGANVTPGEVGVLGRRIMGEYWAPSEVAKVVNNYLSPGLRGNAIYDAYRGLGNALNQAQLGLSGFHLMFTSMDASVSRVALGLEHLASGDVLEGAKAIASTVVAPVTNALKGAKIRAAYLDPEGATPEMQAIANAVKEAGGRVRMDSFYKNSAPQKMTAAWREGGLVGTSKALGYSIPALLETVNKPLMEHIVPMQKLGVFGDMVQKVFADLPPEATLADRRAALGKAWDSVDNRMGQLVYDNLFWNKTFKDLAMASTRSLGWNLGTVREIGGGIGDLADAGGKVLTGGDAEFTHRAAYVMALPITVGMYGAAYMYLRTGQGPTEMKDYFYPKTGDTDADGNPERVQIASYMKDVASYSQHPWETVKHKVNPLPNMVIQMLNNEDYYGDEIRNPDDPAVKQAIQEAKFIAQQFEPLGVRNIMEGNKRGDSKTTMLGAEFGITPAPRAMVRGPGQNKMADILATRKVTGATPEDAEARQARAQILSGLRGNKGVDLSDAVTAAVEHSQLTPKDVVRMLKEVGSTPAQEKFKRLTMTQALDVFKASDPREQGLFAKALVAKIERAGSTNVATTGEP